MKALHAALVVTTFLFSLVSCRSPRADEPARSSDRPGFLFSPALVPERGLQLESGVASTTTDRADTWQGLAQWRYGLTPRVELRASVPNVLLVDADAGDDESGLGDTELGAKFALGDGEGLDSTLALIASLRLPTGEDAWTAHQPGYGLFVAASRPIADDTTCVGAVGVTRSPSGPDDVDAGLLAGAIWHTLGATTSVYVEAAVLPTFEHAPASSYVGAGFTWLLARNAQLDFAADFGLDGDAADAILGIGFCWRW